MNNNINSLESIDKDYIKQFCEKWDIKELSIFGSVSIQSDNEQSDIDILIEFKDKFKNGLLEFIEIKQLLENYFHKKVDLLTLSGLINSKNTVRKNNILMNRVKIYES